MPRKLPNPDDGEPAVDPPKTQLRNYEGMAKLANRPLPEEFRSQNADMEMNLLKNRSEQPIAYQTGQQKAY